MGVTQPKGWQALVQHVPAQHSSFGCNSRTLSKQQELSQLGIGP